jgi:hypothetical protein
VRHHNRPHNRGPSSRERGAPSPRPGSHRRMDDGQSGSSKRTSTERSPAPGSKSGCARSAPRGSWSSASSAHGLATSVREALIRGFGRRSGSEATGARALEHRCSAHRRRTRCGTRRCSTSCTWARRW